MALNLNGLTWDQLLGQSTGATRAPNTTYIPGFGQDSGPQTGAVREGKLNIGDQSFGNAQFMFSPNDLRTVEGAQVYDPADPSNYHYVLYRNPDGSVGQQRQRNTTDMDFLTDAAKFVTTAYGMNGLINGLANTAGSASGSSGGLTGGAGASGAGEAGGVGTGVTSGAAGGSAGGAAAATGGNGMWSTLLDKGLDFATSKAGSTILGGLLGGFGSSSPSSQTVTSRQEIDPRMASILYGNGTNDTGLLGRITGLLDTPQKAGMANFGLQTDNFLNSDGFKTLQGSLGAATSLQNSNLGAPVRGAAAQVQAPSQNDINLAPAYQDMVYGAPGSNPYLTGAIQKGINQSSNAFGNMLTDATRNLTQSILPNIRSGAIVNGAMGGSRQGIAEGNAINDFSTQIGRAMSQFGQNNTDAAVAAQSGAYDTDRNRALSAMLGLGAQQYGVATTNAQLQQQQNLANQQAELATNALNSQNRIAGIGASQGLLGSMYGYGSNNDAYAGNKVGQVAGLLSNYTGLGASSSTTSPLYQNTGAGILGGALLGSQIGKNLNFGGTSGFSTGGGTMDQLTDYGIFSR